MYSTPNRIFVSGSAGSPLRERLIRYVSVRSGSIYPILPARLISFNGRSSFGKGRTAQYYVDRGDHADYRLLILVLVVVAVIAFGLVAKWYLVGRYRLRLESAAGHGASLVH